MLTPDVSMSGDAGGESNVAGDEVAKTVLEITAAVLDKSPSDVHRDARLVDLGAQSFDFVELVIRLEKAFGVSINRSFAIPDQFSVDSYVRAVSEAIARTHETRER